MLILGIETSGRTGGAALLGETHMIASVAFTSDTLYSQRLLPSIEWLLERADVAVSAIDGVAVSRGPGSFTGLRIGMSAGKAIAYANGARIVGVNTLEALAQRAAMPDMPVCSVLDARQGEVYAALFRPEPAPGTSCTALGMCRLERLKPDMAGKIELLRDWITGPTVFAGEGVFRYREELQSMLGDHFLVAPTIRNLPSAEEIVWLGAQRLLRGDSDNPDELQPEYLHKAPLQPPVSRGHGG